MDTRKITPSDAILYIYWVMRNEWQSTNIRFEHSSVHVDEDGGINVTVYADSIAVYSNGVVEIFKDEEYEWTVWVREDGTLYGEC